MYGKLKAAPRNFIRQLGFDVVRHYDAAHTFHSDAYLRHNARRLEHLASLRIPVAGMSVLDVGAGIGDHSHYYIDRGCTVTITDARAENLACLRHRYANHPIRFLDMESPVDIEGFPFDVVHCYGLLYHLSKPGEALAFLRRHTARMLFIETRVSFGEDRHVNLVAETAANPTHAYSGTGCQPTRTWLFNELQGLFPYVYLPTTQPWHEEFPLDWTAPEQHPLGQQRAIFIASVEPLANDRLAPTLLPRQTRHE